MLLYCVKSLQCHLILKSKNSSFFLCMFVLFVENSFVCGKHLCVGFKNRLMIIGVVQSLVSYYNWEFKKRYEKKIVSEE